MMLYKNPDQNEAKIAVCKFERKRIMNHGTKKTNAPGPSGSGGNANA